MYYGYARLVNMKSIQDILKGFNPVEDKYISREYQQYGIELAEKLDDWKHRGLYIKFAKTLPRAVLERAYSFVAGANAANKGALFMWKLREMGVIGKKKQEKVSKKTAVDLPASR